MDDEIDKVELMCAKHASVDTHSRFSDGAVFGDWRVTAFIARGGSGEVYCAEHVRLGTPAAVKVLVREDGRAKKRFVHEAKLLAELKSPAFPRFFAFGEAYGTAYLAMELLEPGELPSSDRDVARFLLKICEAAGELHSKGYIHRDIKPGNILWRSPTEPVLSDLGLAKETSLQNLKPDTPGLTIVDGRRGGAGTPGFGAPEQMERGIATEASDIHALGVIADRCFDGKAPRAWKRIIERATSSIPAHRYQSVSALACAIRQRNFRRTIVSFAAAASVLAALVAGFSAWWAGGGNETWRWNSLCNTRVTGSTRYVVVQLSGKTVSFARPIQLKPGEYRITGPGRIDADISGPANTLVRLKNCVFNNMSTLAYPQNGIHYELDGGTYLNFANQDDNCKRQRFIHSRSNAPNEVRFHGPLTIKELNELRYRESQEMLLREK